jgi:hypothetical protein
MGSRFPLAGVTDQWKAKGQARNDSPGLPTLIYLLFGRLKSIPGTSAAKEQTASQPSAPNLLKSSSASRQVPEGLTTRYSHSSEDSSDGATSSGSHPNKPQSLIRSMGHGTDKAFSQREIDCLEQPIDMATNHCDHPRRILSLFKRSPKFSNDYLLLMFGQITKRGRPQFGHPSLVSKDRSASINSHVLAPKRKSWYGQAPQRCNVEMHVKADGMHIIRLLWPPTRPRPFKMGFLSQLLLPFDYQYKWLGF